MMRPNRKQNSILNSPFVRALINPVKTIIPSSDSSSPNALPASQPIPSSSKPSGVNPYLSIIAQERAETLEEPEEHHLIPTQPSEPDLKGKKRAREDKEEPEEEEWNEVEGTRFGVITRHQEGKNLPKELEKCTSFLLSLVSDLS